MFLEDDVEDGIDDEIDPEDDMGLTDGAELVIEYVSVDDELVDKTTFDAEGLTELDVDLAVAVTTALNSSHCEPLETMRREL